MLNTLFIVAEKDSIHHWIFNTLEGAKEYSQYWCANNGGSLIIYAIARTAMAELEEVKSEGIESLLQELYVNDILVGLLYGDDVVHLAPQHIGQGYEICLALLNLQLMGESSAFRDL